MLPVPPSELFALASNPNSGQPFSENTYRFGGVISIPIFIKSIYTTASMSNILVKSAKEKAFINLIRNEAILVSLNANLQYIESLDLALKSKKRSLMKTQEFVVIKVNNGRGSGAELLKINNAVNEVALMQNDLAMQREEVIALIASYTGITLTKALPMEQSGTYQSGDFRSLNPQIDKVAAGRWPFVQRRKSFYLPWWLRAPTAKILQRHTTMEPT
jgi:hypothetical protein